MIGRNQPNLASVDGVEYASKPTFAKLDPTTTTITAMKTLSGTKFGRSDVIRYIENSNGDNIFIGGNSNFDKNSSSDPDNWKLTMYVVNKNTMDLEGAYTSTTAETATYEAAKYID